MSADDAWLFPVVSATLKHFTAHLIPLGGLCRPGWTIHYREILWEGVDKLASRMVLLDSWNWEHLEGIAPCQFMIRYPLMA